MSTNTIDNLLCFVASNFDTLERHKLDKLLVDSYDLDELTASKLLLITECEKINLTNAIATYVKRRLFTKSQIDLKQKIVKDILDIWSVVDVQKGGQLPTNFVAAVPVAASVTSTAAATTTTAINTNHVQPDIQHVINLLHDLRFDFAKQQESIQWLTNIVSNTYRHLTVSPLTEFVSQDSITSPLNLSRSNSPRSLPRIPFERNNERQRSQSKKRNLSALSSSFIPAKRSHTSPLTEEPPLSFSSIPAPLPPPPSTSATSLVADSASRGQIQGQSVPPPPPLTISFPASLDLHPASTIPLPASTNLLLATDDSLPASFDLLPASTDLLPTSTGSPPASTVSLPASSDSFPASTSALLASTDSAPASTNSLPAPTELLQASLSSTKEVLEAALKAAKEVAVAARTVTHPLPLPPPPRHSQLSLSPLTTAPTSFSSYTAVTRLPPPPPPPLSPLFAPPPSFSDRAEEPEKNGDQWHTKSRSRNKKSTSIGRKRESGLKAVPPESKSYGLFAIYRLEASTSADAVRHHLHQQGIEVGDVWMLGSSIKGTKTAKVRVAKAHEQRAKDPSIWPLHCRIRDWDNDKTRGQRSKKENSSSVV